MTVIVLSSFLLSLLTVYQERIIVTVSDTKRNCFYTLSSKNTISMYSPDGEKSIQHIQTLSSLYKSVQDKAPGSPAVTPQNFQIINIHTVDPSESRMNIQLIAVTTNGVRLYFAPSMGYGSSYSMSSSSGSRNLRPLSLVHIRLPPVNLIHPDEQEKRYRPAPPTYGASTALPQPASRPYIVSTLDNSCYANGLTITAQAGDTDGTDYILCLAPDLTRIGNLGQLNLPERSQQPHFDMITGQYTNPASSNRPLTEYATLLSIPGRTWAMAAISKATVVTPQGTAAPSDINELASQFDEYPNQFMLLTNVGLTFLIKRRAIEYLKAVLEDLQSEANVQPIIQFRDRCVIYPVCE